MLEINVFKVYFFSRSSDRLAPQYVYDLIAHVKSFQISIVHISVVQHENNHNDSISRESPRIIVVA